MKEKYPEIQSYKDPTIDTFMLALEEKGLTKGREGYIRTKLMHFFNDINRDMEIPISEPPDIQIKNYKRLLIIANKNLFNVRKSSIVNVIKNINMNQNIIDIKIEKHIV